MAPSLCIAVKSCHRDMDAGFHDAIRATWGKDAKNLGISVVFFLGKDPTQQDTRIVRRYTPGEVVLDCADDYMSLPVKTRRICQWAQAKLYTHLFFCDTDTYVRPKELQALDFANYDYAGWFFVGEPGGAPFDYHDEYGHYQDFRGWASGGLGYFLSRKAADVVANTPSKVWAEDAYVGQSLAPMIDNKTMTGKNYNFDGGPRPTEHWKKKQITTPFTPEIVHLMHKHGGMRTCFQKGLLMP